LKCIFYLFQQVIELLFNVIFHLMLCYELTCYIIFPEQSMVVCCLACLQMLSLTVLLVLPSFVI